MSGYDCEATEVWFGASGNSGESIDAANGDRSCRSYRYLSSSLSSSPSRASVLSGLGGFCGEKSLVGQPAGKAQVVATAGPTIVRSAGTQRVRRLAHGDRDRKIRTDQQCIGEPNLGPGLNVWSRPTATERQSRQLSRGLPGCCSRSRVLWLSLPCLQDGDVAHNAEILQSQGQANRDTNLGMDRGTGYPALILAVKVYGQGMAGNRLGLLLLAAFQCNPRSRGPYTSPGSWSSC
jgi:hypothetical protein